ncbi:hypothetical protein [Haloprofundus halophilus]|uniref:hypothetical protein n=1 Tax=Haloprofundus halophilus TaxID=2283527 RepID=UPI000E43AD81|nr:hypothetical protein [Haloprofundus halophilus]
MIVLSLTAVQPALAQETGICSSARLPGMIEGFFQLTTGIGVLGVAIAWQADSLAELFTTTPEQRRNIKQHRRSALKSGLILLILGPLYTVAGSMMGLPLAECVNLTPW